MESLSPDLAKLLDSLGLCTARDLRRCARRVKRLSRGLPAFDFVWLDALRQAGRLTGMQAQWLADGRGNELAVGPYVLSARLSVEGPLTHYTARDRNTREQVLLTELDVSRSEADPLLDRLHQLTARLAEINHPSLRLPYAAGRDGHRIAVTATGAQGQTLFELLTRRGRFPVPVVIAMARQLVSALATLERADVIHGDLRCGNVMLTRDGTAILLHTGLLMCHSPQVSIHGGLPAGSYDAVAPELIGRHAARSTATDMYAFGCLLWELLSGRPVFVLGDPLAKLIAHRSQRVPPVSERNPLVPPAVAEIILSLTDPDPGGRPRTFRQLEEQFGRSGPADRALLRRFARTFESAAPRLAGDSVTPGPRTTSQLVTGLLIILVACGVAFQLGGEVPWAKSAGAVTEEARVPAAGQTRQASATRESDGTANDTDVARPLPDPDAYGAILLSGPGPFAASEVSSTQPLVIRAAEGAKPVIVVTEAPWRLSAPMVVLDGVHITGAPASSANEPLLDVASQDLGFERCRIIDASTSAAARPSLIRWRMQQSADSIGGRLGLAQSVLIGAGAAIDCESVPRSLLARHVLRTGGSSLLTIHPAVKTAMRMDLRDCTLRESGSLIEATIDDASPAGAVQLNAERCVFAPGQEGALVRLRGEGHLARNVALVQVTGIDSLLTPDTPLLMFEDSAGARFTPPPETLSVEGLRLVEVTFAGPQVTDPAASQITAPRLPGKGPGWVMTSPQDVTR